jgi:hypothetical protein
MAPSSPATARRAAQATPRSAPARRPPLRVLEPAPRRHPLPKRVRRSTIWLSAVLVIGSLLAVVVGDALVTQGQVHLASEQSALASAVAAQKSLEVAVAEKAAPPVVVAQAKSQGLIVPPQVVYLPEVPLNVPLPAPQTSPLPSR